MKKVIIGFLMLMFTATIFAQRGEKVESIKIAFIASKLNLDPKVAEKFWPVYNQYESELRSIIEERRKAKNNDENVEDMLDAEQKVLDLRKRYSTQFAKIITQEQVATLFRAEKEFRQMIMKRASNRGR
jgi:hypothetical protein